MKACPNSSPCLLVTGVRVGQPHGRDAVRLQAAGAAQALRPHGASHRGLRAARCVRQAAGSAPLTPKTRSRIASRPVDPVGFRFNADP
eukprot:350908-Chlamydomonas_euryale.AAC.2